MSLTSFVQVPKISEALQSIRPIIKFTKHGSHFVVPKSKRYSLIGTAFDYLLRFELQRVAPHALSTPWTASYAPEVIKANWLSISQSFMSLEARPSKDQVYVRALEIVKRAKGVHKNYLTLKSPTNLEKAEMAKIALMLAALDYPLRSHTLSPTFDKPEACDVEELCELLAIVRFEELIHPSTLILNPTFESASELVGGADADLIVGDLLVDIKTIKEFSFAKETHHQLLGYFLLSRFARLKNQAFPEIKRVGIYFSRYGQLWTMDVDKWLANPKFNDVEQLFCEEAKRAPHN